MVDVVKVGNVRFFFLCQPFHLVGGLKRMNEFQGLTDLFCRAGAMVVVNVGDKVGRIGRRKIPGAVHRKINDVYPLAEQKFPLLKEDSFRSPFREKELIHFEDIFIDASKAFVINSALRWAIKEIKENNMREPRWKKFKRMIDQYVAGMVDIKWSSGKPISIEVKYDRS